MAFGRNRGVERQESCAGHATSFDVAACTPLGREVPLRSKRWILQGGIEVCRQQMRRRDCVTGVLDHWKRGGNAVGATYFKASPTGPVQVFESELLPLSLWRPCSRGLLLFISSATKYCQCPFADASRQEGSLRAVGDVGNRRTSPWHLEKWHIGPRCSASACVSPCLVQRHDSVHTCWADSLLLLGFRLRIKR
jgi:hypothetical protein